MSESWNTKWGPRKVRHDPPTMVEAIAAAQDLSSDQDEQAGIAAGLMGVPLADVKAEMQKMIPNRRAVRLVTAPTREKGVMRTVIVERKTSRRVIARGSRPMGSIA